MNQHGQSLIECVLGLSVFAGLLLMLSLVVGFQLHRLWLNVALYDAVICLAEERRNQDCRELIMLRAQAFPVAKVDRIQLTANKQHYTGQLQVQSKSSLLPGFRYQLLQKFDLGRLQSTRRVSRWSLY